MIGAVLFVIMFAGMAWRWRLAEDGRIAAVRDLSLTAGRLAESERGLYLSRIAQAHDHARAGRFAQAAELLRQCLPQRVAGRPAGLGVVLLAAILHGRP